VNKPANPDSVIYTQKPVTAQTKNILLEKNEDFLISGVSDKQLTNSMENNIMSLDLDPVIKEVAEIKSKIEAMEVKTAQSASETISLLEQTIKANNEIIKSHETKIAEITAAIELLNSEKELAAKKADETMKEKMDEYKKTKSELDSAMEVIAAYKNKEEEMMKKEKKMKRMASLIEVGLTNDAASAAADTFDSLSDESFDAMTTLLAGMPPWLKDKNEKTKEEDKSEKKKASEVVDANVLESAEVDNSVNLSVGGEVDNSVENTRAALVEFVSSRLGKKL
jgi:chromosome segregation ATPase